ncbi:metal-dependent phosphoesterase PHP family [Clostridium aceticum]|uniref:Metal-dependent phosphoesterase PHP family n=1 Tax=Clostridium aceticum TaxID=84022 RepID=A0A0D8I8Y8_9CLOT|nr:PHP domain-containing protein [Clostridium aceticum]AKL94579.1 metal-dependent phosphoesterase PHP family [Clostridium aceticum]KJF26509.1 histidinol phosphatase [Clostridium aceticum]
MFIDIHIHEKTYSNDSHIALDEIIDRAKEMGLDGICITDHDSNDLMDKAHNIAKKRDFLIIVGAEILTYEGDMLVFGLDHLPKEKLHADELLKLVEKSKGVAISAHPFRPSNRATGNYNRSLRGFRGIEAFNGTTKSQYNTLAYYLAQELNLPALGGSDAHHIHQIGQCATLFPDGIRDEKDLIQAIVSREVSPIIYRNNTFQSIVKQDSLSMIIS